MIEIKYDKDNKIQYFETLVGADLSGFHLREKDFSRQDLGDVNFSGADLRDVDFESADLSFVNLKGADISGASFYDTNLTGTNISVANLTEIREDVFAVLDSSPSEARAVLDALNAGKVDGSTYSGECSCLVGTIANSRGCSYEDLPIDSDRPAEKFFLAIDRGNTPETNQFAALAAKWIQEWIDTHV